MTRPEAPPEAPIDAANPAPPDKPTRSADEQARAPRRKRKRKAKGSQGAGPGPAPSRVPRWLRGRLWALPVVLAAAGGLSFVAARRRDPRPVEYACLELPLSKLEVARSIEIIRPEEIERLEQARELLRDDPPRAIAQLEEDQSTFGYHRFDKLLWQEREALLIHGLQCTGKPFRERAEAFLEASPHSYFIASVKHDLEAEASPLPSGSSRPIWRPPPRCPPLSVAPDPHPGASAEEAEAMTELRALVGKQADDVPWRVENAQEHFGRTVFSEERDALWLHAQLCLDRARFRPEVEDRARAFFEQYPTSRWRKEIERELDAPPARAMGHGP